MVWDYAEVQSALRFIAGLVLYQHYSPYYIAISLGESPS